MRLDTTAVLVICLSLLWLTLAPGRAGAETILTIGLPDGTQRVLDRSDLAAMPQDGFVTTTIWTEGPQSFRGVRVASLMTALGIPAGHALLTAANGYQVESGIKDLMPDAALIAIERNGAPMSLRDKGPLWLVYEYDSAHVFRTEVVYARSIWQLDRIDFTE
ncbi:hypothetical protein ATO6_11485 [Oceanicola sp. 22II-s10i]|nr:hypothetical protein ATO6_11485 [Oceanicola sp. 22II-s10i]